MIAGVAASSRLDRPRVLLVSPFPVFPSTHGGSVRVHRLATGLASAGASVVALFPWHPKTGGRSFIHEHVRWHTHQLPANVLAAAVPERLLPAFAAQALQPPALGPARLLSRLGAFDVVQFEFPGTIRWGRHVAGDPLRVYSAHNVEVDYASVGTRRASRLTRRWIGRLEREATRASDLIVACTNADAERLKALYDPPARCVVVANGPGPILGPAERAAMRERARRELGIEPDETALVFIGGRAPHNVEALRRLERDVLPRILTRAVLVAAGLCAPPACFEAGPNRVLRLGFVEDVRPVLAAADLGVNPVSSGSGSSVKVADYLAAGLPVLTTPFGARGFERFSERMVLAELDDFAAAATRHPNGRSMGVAEGLAELEPAKLGRLLLGAYVEALQGRGGD